MIIWRQNTHILVPAPTQRNVLNEKCKCMVTTLSSLSLTNGKTKILLTHCPLQTVQIAEVSVQDSMLEP